MINKVRKGRSKEQKCVDDLRKEGFTLFWKANRQIVRNKFNKIVCVKKIDLFGLFDVCGYNPITKEIRLIQVKSNRTDNKTRDEIRDFKIEKIGRWIYIWKDRKGWIKEYYE